MSARANTYREVKHMPKPEGYYGEQHESLPFYESIAVMTDFWNIVESGGFDVLEAPWNTDTSEFLRTNTN